MDCELAFVTLTAGPFPAGRASDVDVERHLLACKACRRIADALRPDNSIAHESLSAMERTSLPRYRKVQRTAPAMASAPHPGGLSRHDDAKLEASLFSHWRHDLSVTEHETQVAAFSLSTRRRTATALEAMSMLATLTAAAVAFWCLGVLAL